MAVSFFCGGETIILASLPSGSILHSHWVKVSFLYTLPSPFLPSLALSLSLDRSIILLSLFSCLSSPSSFQPVVLLLFSLVSIELFQLLRSSNYCFSPQPVCYNSVCLANCRIFRFANYYSVTIFYFLEEIASTKQLWTTTSSVVILIKNEIKFKNKQTILTFFNL